MTLSEAGFFRIVWIGAVVLSVGGVIFAAFVSKDMADGGRGGALADALALAALFGTRNYAADTYEALTTRAIELRSRILKLSGSGAVPGAIPNEESEIAEVKRRLGAFETRLRLDAQGAYTQNFALAVATFVGTVFWGFGDLFAAWLVTFTRWIAHACGRGPSVRQFRQNGSAASSLSRRSRSCGSFFLTRCLCQAMTCLPAWAMPAARGPGSARVSMMSRATRTSLAAPRSSCSRFSRWMNCFASGRA